MPRRSNGTNIDSNDSFIRVRSGYSNVYAVNAHLLSTEKEECDSKLSESDTLKMTQGRTYEDMSFLGVFFNFQYYLLLIPFKTVLETGTNQYRIQTHIVQKIFCLCIHTVVILIVTSLLILAVLRLTNNLEPKIVDIFTLVSILSTFVSFFLTIFMVWRRREEYLEVVENTRVNLKRAQKIKLLIYLCFTILNIGWGTVTWFMLQDGAHYASLAKLEQYLFPTNTSSYNNLTSVNFPRNNIISILEPGLLVVFVHSSLFYIITQGSFLMIVLSIRQLGKTLETELRIGTKVLDIEKGNELISKLKRKMDLITNVYGNRIMAFYISSICYYAQAPHVLLGKRGNTEKLIMAYFTLTSVMWLFSAEFHKNVQETVLKWIAYHTRNVNLRIEDRLYLVSLSNEMAADPVTLSSRYFSVTYQQFSAMLGLVVTYAIIVFQQQNSPSCIIDTSVQSEECRCR